MSKGSPVVQIRVPADLLEQVLVSIARCNVNRQQEPYTLSGWVLAAIRERLAKHRRSSVRPRGRGKESAHKQREKERSAGPAGSQTAGPV